MASLGTIDPDLVYLGLVIGLWLGVTAVYIPGKGVMEAIALLALGGVALVLVAMPTNWWAVLLLVIGVSSFLVFPFVSQRSAQYAEAGLVFQAIGGFFLFNGLTVSWLLIAVTVGLAILYHRLVLLPMLRNLRSMTTIDETERLLGARGRVVKPVDPVGTVHINGELWTARSDRKLKTGDEVVVVERAGLELLVEKPKRNDSSEEA
jgi:membrane-bound serine protease (ClpP class)